MNRIPGCYYYRYQLVAPAGMLFDWYADVG